MSDSLPNDPCSPEPADSPAAGSAAMPAGAQFPSTCWSRILGQPVPQAPQAPTAASTPDFEALARAYWRPISGYIRSKWGLSREDTLDATQDYFVWMLETGFIAKADRQRGSFRAFLKTSLRNFLIDRERRKTTQKHGGTRKQLSLDIDEEGLASIEPIASKGTHPEEVLDSLWRTELVERATTTLALELRAAGKGVYFEVFQDYFMSPEDGLDYKAVAARYGITSTKVSNYLMHAKRRYREQLRAAVLETVASPEALEDELAWLFGNLRP